MYFCLPVRAAAAASPAPVRRLLCCSLPRYQYFGSISAFELSPRSTTVQGRNKRDGCGSPLLPPPPPGGVCW